MRVKIDFPQQSITYYMTDSDFSAHVSVMHLVVHEKVAVV